MMDWVLREIRAIKGWAGSRMAEGLASSETKQFSKGRSFTNLTCTHVGFKYFSLIKVMEA